MANLPLATIIEDFGRRFSVQDDTGQIFSATTRARRLDFACGDRVYIRHLNDKQAVIEQCLERHSVLFRQDAYRTKLIAANADQLFFVSAALPAPNEILLQRALLAAEAAGIHAAIVLNKNDLPETATWRARLTYYQQCGYPLFETNALTGDIGSLHQALDGHLSIFIGQSGMGKSTLTNALLEKNIAITGDLSSGQSGRHTTTYSRLYRLNAQSAIIDPPGLQAFGLYHLDPQKLIHYFPDMRAYLGQCRFHNCRHRHEPGCAIVAAVTNHQLPAQRLQFLQEIDQEISQNKF